ncbi:MAG: hypothetical protein RLZZ422_1086 [Pseudomonadota bacterium]|jgi:alpha,alpha-trehalose phosphorylase
MNPSAAASGWHLQETSLSEAVEHYRKNETLMALCNGYLSLRGSFEEETIQLGHAGTYMNGFYEFHTLHYGEKFSGYPDHSQVMINLPDPKSVVLTIKGHTFSLDEGKVLHFERQLDIHTATLTRSIIWESPLGDQVQIDSIRFVSATHKHLACLQYQVKALNFNGLVSLESAIALNRTNISRADDPRIGVTFEDDIWRIHTTQHTEPVIQVSGKTTQSQLDFRCAVASLFTGVLCTTEFKKTDTKVSLIAHSTLQQGDVLTLHKFICYDRSDTPDPMSFVVTMQQQGFDTLLVEHKAWWAKTWANMDIQIEGAQPLQQAIRFNMFHLTQSVGKDGQTNISAKGMTGEGYEGHYFWDTEIYMIPFFLYTQPEIAKQLLMFRYNTLDKARNRARELGHTKGALYPWRTINGDECSAYYPAGTAQYHINADIAYALQLYYNVTQDHEFMENYGLEMLLELSNLWMVMGVFDPEKGNAFCIQEVTGPDEYTCLVNNNFYTNAMVKHQIGFALKCLDQNFKLNSNTQKLVENFDRHLAQQIVEKIYLPYSNRLQIHMQDDAFLSRPVWDLANTPRDKFPLLMHYHPLTLYRHQVCKQADVVLAELLLSDQFSLEQKQRDFDYYAKITTHDSSLSTGIYGILACELGDMEQSYQYYIKTARTDLDDFHHNAKDGIHAANMAGSWMGIVYGFAGMRLNQGVLSFNPKLPNEWQSFSFPIHTQDKTLKVLINSSGTFYTLEQGNELAINHKDQLITLHHHQTIQLH